MKQRNKCCSPDKIQHAIVNRNPSNCQEDYLHLSKYLELKTDMRLPSLKKIGAAAPLRVGLGDQLLEKVASEVWSVKHKEYSPKARRHRIITVSPGNPLWAHIILPADHGDVAAAWWPAAAGGAQDCLCSGETQSWSLQTCWDACLMEAWVEQMEQSSLGSKFLKLKPWHGRAWICVRDKIISWVWFLIEGRFI